MPLPCWFNPAQYCCFVLLARMPYRTVASNLGIRACACHTVHMGGAVLASVGDAAIAGYGFTTHVLVRSLDGYSESASVVQNSAGPIRPPRMP